LSPQKRVGLLLDAVREAGIQVPVTIVGDGPARSELERHARNLGLTNVRFLGALPDDAVPPRVAQADVAAFPSRNEGLGLAAAEALMLGVPVVATTDGGGVLDLVREGAGGRITPPHAGPFGAALLRALGDSSLRAEAVLAGQRLEVKLVGGVVVGAHRLRVAVDHDGLEPGFLEREGGVDAAVVELDSLADPVRSAAENHDLLAVRRFSFALRFITGVEVRREALELRGARIHAIEHGADAELLAGDVLRGIGDPGKVAAHYEDYLARRPDGFVPGLGPAPDLLAASFALEPGQSSPEIYEAGDKLALVQLLERKEPDPEEIESRMESLRSTLLDEKRVTRADAWLNARRAALVAVSQQLIKKEVIDAQTLKAIIEESSPSPMIVPGTDVDGKKRTSAAASQPAKDIDASEMEAAESG